MKLKNEAVEIKEAINNVARALFEGNLHLPLSF